MKRAESMKIIEAAEHDGLAIEERTAAFGIGRAESISLKSWAPYIREKREWVSEPLAQSLAVLVEQGRFNSAAIPKTLSNYQNWIVARFQDDVDEKWLRHCASLGNWVFEHELPTYIMGAMMAACNERMASIISENISDPEIRQAANALLNRIGQMESEIVVGRVDRIRRKKEKQRFADFSNQFENNIAELVNQASRQSEQVRKMAKATTERARDLMHNASDIASSAQQSAGAMSNAAENSAQLIHGLEAAKTSIENVLAASNRASGEADKANEVFAQLHHNVHAIESVVGLIRDVAGQTNLLALNATIEAARAGDAGRGFAVVAQEVKSLSTQTSRATDDIVRQIDQIQQSAESTVSANSLIAETIGDVTSSSGEFERSMDAQSSRLVTVASMIDETAMTAASMSDTVANMRRTSEHVVDDAEKVDAAFTEIEQKMADLQSAVGSFLTKLAA